MNRHMWTLAAVLLAAGLVVGCGEKKTDQGPGDAGKGTVGVWNPQRVQDETGVTGKYTKYMNDAKAAAQKALDPIIAPKQLEINRLRRLLQEKIDKLPATMKDDPKKLAERDDVKPDIDAINKIDADMRTEGQKKQDKLNAYNEQLTSIFRNAVQPALKEVCDSNKIRILLQVGAASYVAPGSDLTDNVLDYFKKHPMPEPPLPPVNFD